MDAPLLHLVAAVDHVEVIALLIGQDRDAWNGYRLHRFSIFNDYSDEFSVREFPYCAPAPVPLTGFRTSPRIVMVFVFPATVLSKKLT
jgi:hypothetical protein